jgi:hypothetical protein
MRTTISISDSLLELAKKASYERRVSLGQIIEDSLRRTLMSRPKETLGALRPSLITYKGTGLKQGVDLDSSAALLDVMEAE